MTSAPPSAPAPAPSVEAVTDDGSRGTPTPGDERSGPLAPGGTAMTDPLLVETSIEGRSVYLALCGELTYGTVPVFDEHVRT